MVHSSGPFFRVQELGAEVVFGVEGLGYPIRCLIRGLGFYAQGLRSFWFTAQGLELFLLQA